MSSSIKRKVFVAGDTGYASWMEAQVVDRMEDADLVCMVGGADVSSHLYGKKRHPSAYSDAACDAHEVRMFKKARALNLPIIGICKGSQLSCVMAGGILVQNMGSSGYLHPIHTFEGRRIVVTSTHHQLQHPWVLPPDDYKILGWATDESDYHEGETAADEMIIGKVPGNIETEEVFYRKINTLALQHHPEHQSHLYGRDAQATEYIDHCRSLLDHLLSGGL